MELLTAMARLRHILQGANWHHEYVQVRKDDLRKVLNELRELRETHDRKVA
jgi:hypothetical protein